MQKKSERAEIPMLRRRNFTWFLTKNSGSADAAVLVVFLRLDRSNLTAGTGSLINTATEHYCDLSVTNDNAVQRDVMIYTF
jgi:hypothetical protein